MQYDKSVAEHYLHGNLLKAIEAALPKIGKTPNSITLEDLSPMDEFHIGGREATEQLIEQLNFTPQSHVLDIGCGLGGTARFVATRCRNHITGIDLTEEYIETGKTLCKWLNLDTQITLQQGSALSMPFPDNTFDGSYMLHVGMNIEDKASLFAEVQRVLRPGAMFGIYDVMRDSVGELTYPVPWASSESTCQLATLEEYTDALKNSGFSILKEKNYRDFALQFFTRVAARAAKKGTPPALGLHLLMQESTTSKIKNMTANIAAGYIAPVEIIAQKQSPPR